ncbi:MAG TPA: glutathione S-transferase C-terminal domain-containing protein [Candidatus Stackebrandtia excrementipullorum]|nr:glutathione S-transferase C-terminal domain-containing protein [Candidatus Stackebrandtia excrementipullorum]
MVENNHSTDASGEFHRSRSHFDDRILADADARWPVEPGRYRLVVSLACPWASRMLVVRRLLGLESAISLGVTDPIQDERSWRFTLDPGGVDPVLGIGFIGDAYYAREADYTGGISVPAIVDIPSGRLVTNDYLQMTLDLSTQWTAYHREGAPDLYPEHARAEIDEIVEAVFQDVNNGVYRAGFAAAQDKYDRAYTALFERLDRLEERLATRRYLVGDTITEADIRLFTTLVRFDAVYHGHFKCNRNKLSEMPALWAYARDLYQTPGFTDTVDFDHIKRHYYQVHTDINPTRIVPLGPDLSGWNTPHGREELGGRPFGDGTAPPPPPTGEDFNVLRPGRALSVGESDRPGVDAVGGDPGQFQCVVHGGQECPGGPAPAFVDSVGPVLLDQAGFDNVDLGDVLSARDLVAPVNQGVPMDF